MSFLFLLAFFDTIAAFGLVRLPQFVIFLFHHPFLSFSSNATLVGMPVKSLIFLSVFMSS